MLATLSIFIFCNPLSSKNQCWWCCQHLLLLWVPKLSHVHPENQCWWCCECQKFHAFIQKHKIEFGCKGNLWSAWTFDNILLPWLEQIPTFYGKSFCPCYSHITLRSQIIIFFLSIVLLFSIVYSKYDQRQINWNYGSIDRTRDG